MTMTSTPEQHYDAEYFNWQSAIGRFGAEANSFKFAEYISPSDAVLDFGCGGGYMLAAITSALKKGVEINPAALAECRKQNIEALPSLDDIPDGWADVAISHHALEHVSDPLQTLRLLNQKMKPDGTVVCIVPCEGYKVAYAENSIDNHLYTWSPMNLGNLFKAAGFRVIKVERIAHRWPPRPVLLQRYLGWPLFHLACKLTAHLRPSLTQLRIVAEKAKN